ncbi:MAG: hypothetical protein AB7G39_10640 [Alphaproteobacteria bacterium]
MQPDELRAEWADRTHPIREDMGFQRRFWRWQRAGWLGMAAVVLLALAGLFSNGPLGRIEAGAADGAIAVEADRFLTQGTSFVWTIRLAPQGAETPLLVGPDFARAVTIETLQPAALRATNAPDGLRLVFATPPGSGRLTVRLTGRTEGGGTLHAAFGAAGGETVSITHLVYP